MSVGDAAANLLGFILRLRPSASTAARRFVLIGKFEQDVLDQRIGLTSLVGEHVWLLP